MPVGCRRKTIIAPLDSAFVFRLPDSEERVDVDERTAALCQFDNAQQRLTRLIAKRIKSVHWPFFIDLEASVTRYDKVIENVPIVNATFYRLQLSAIWQNEILALINYENRQPQFETLLKRS